MAPNTWRAYRSDLADFATWVAYTGAEWRAPEVVAAYLRTLEDGGAAYATISRRLTSIHKLVAIAAIAAGDLDYEDPTKHPRVGVTLQAIRRRLSTDQDQANPLTSTQRLLQVLLSIDTATVAGIRDVALLLVGWYGALRRSELAGLGRHHLSLDRDGLVLQLPRSKASPDHSVWVPIANQPDSDWNPTTRLEDWLEAAARLRPTRIRNSCRSVLNLERGPSDADQGFDPTRVHMVLSLVSRRLWGGHGLEKRHKCVSATCAHAMTEPPQGLLDRLPVSARLHLVKALGTKVWVAFKVLNEEAIPRCAEASTALRHLPLLRALAILPHGVPMPHALLPEEMWPELASAPACVVQATHDGFVRLVHPPIEPLLVIAQSREWSHAFKKATRFETYCAIAIHLQAEPADAELCALEASVLGFGLAVREDVLLKPEASAERLRGHKLWSFAEEILRQFSPVPSDQHAHTSCV